MFASDNECNVNQTKDLRDFDSRINPTDLQPACAGESPIQHACTRACKHCSSPFINPDNRVKHCSPRCARASKLAHLRARANAYRAAYPERERCRQTLKNAIYTGQIRRPRRCEKCAAEGATQGHHHDYSRPLFVTWLCRKCHASLEDGRHFGAGQRKGVSDVHGLSLREVARRG